MRFLRDAAITVVVLVLIAVVAAVLVARRGLAADQEPGRLERTIAGPMWHGPALGEVLEGVSAEQAAARPIPGAHSIWELVLHITVWAGIALERLRGRALDDPPSSKDWQTPSTTTAEAWAQATEHLGAAYRALAREVASLDAEALAAEIPTRGYSAATMLRGVVEHGTYHGGQIAILKRALESRH